MLLQLHLPKGHWACPFAFYKKLTKLLSKHHDSSQAMYANHLG